MKVLTSKVPKILLRYEKVTPQRFQAETIQPDTSISKHVKLPNFQRVRLSLQFDVSDVSRVLCDPPEDWIALSCMNMPSHTVVKNSDTEIDVIFTLYVKQLTAGIYDRHIASFHGPPSSLIPAHVELSAGQRFPVGMTPKRASYATQSSSTPFIALS